MSRLAEFKSKFFAYIQLARPVNAIITFLSVLVAAFITGTLEPLGAVILACISAGLIGSAANTINDYYDVEIDRINKPQRTLAAGKLMPQSALAAAIVQYALSEEGRYFGELLNSLIDLF